MSTPDKPKGAYVPPHLRKQQATGGQLRGDSSPYHGSPSPNNKPHNQNNRSRPGGRGGGGGGRGRGGGRGYSKSRSPKPDHKRDGGRSKSPKRGNNNNHHHHHYPHLTKEQLHHQKEQLHILTDAITRICCINLERRPDRWESFQQHLHQSLGKKMGHSLSNKVERYNAVDGIGSHEAELPQLVQQTWDATINAKWDRHIQEPMTKKTSAGEVGCALSHIELWRELVQMHEAMPAGDEYQQPNMLILEDDCLFYSPKLAMNKQQVRELSPPRGKSPNQKGQTPITYNHDFLTAFQLAWSQLPEDWDIWYLGFSDRGDRLPIHDDFHLPKPHHHDFNKHPSMSVQLFRPTYGFHTHAYVVNAKAAKKLLDNLPVVGPLDVWLADNQWFGMRVYCSVVEGEGWKQTGAWLITQNRKAAVKDSDIKMSGRKEGNN